jgi:hypothetical protein
MAMIKKTIYYALSLFLAYTIMIWFKPDWDTSQHQWQDNLIKAQQYIYENNDSMQNVIAGSSLSTRLAMEKLPYMYNLSMGGQSIFDCLYIIAHKDILPKNVFIEMNFVFRKESNDFLSSFNSPVIMYSRKMIPSLRDENQPVGIAGKFIFSLYSLIAKNKPAGSGSQPVNDELFNKMQTLLDTELLTIS